MAKRTQAHNKTQPGNRDVSRYLAGIENSGRREDAFELLTMMEEITGEPVGAGVEGVGGEFAAAFAIAFDKLRDRAVELGAIEIG